MHLACADAAENGFSGMDADADAQGFRQCGFVDRIQLVQRLAYFKCCAKRTRATMSNFILHAENCHDAVAHEFVDIPGLCSDDLAHSPHILVQNIDNIIRQTAF